MSELLSDSYIWMLIRLRVHRMANLTDTCEDTRTECLCLLGLSANLDLVCT